MDKNVTQKGIREFTVGHESETEAFGRRLAAVLKAGDVVALTGDLGTGKTTLTKYIAAELGVQRAVTSPTFTIIKEYTDGRLPLYHFDVYRLESDEEMDELGYEEYFYGPGVTVVEWADKISGCLPADAFRVHISYGGDESARVCAVSGPEERITCLF